jgi:hypothetical protein
VWQLNRKVSVRYPHSPAAVRAHKKRSGTQPWRHLNLSIYRYTLYALAVAIYTRAVYCAV